MLSKTDLDDALHALPIIEEIGVFAGVPGYSKVVEQWISRGEATLFTEGESFVVLHPRAFGDHLTVIVRAAWSKEGNALEKYQPEIQELAKAVGASKLRFETARVGFDRCAPKLGWEKTLTTWEQGL
ncbi:MAG: hypothetical protein ACRBBW_20845 [Cellvibrionaceae bacterium]